MSYGYRFKCDACCDGDKEISQPREPELVCAPINGETVSLQCCITCAKLIKEELEKLEADKPLKPEPIQEPVMMTRTRAPLLDLGNTKRAEEDAAYTRAQAPPREQQPNDFSDEIKRADRLENKMDQLTAAVHALINVLQPK